MRYYFCLFFPKFYISDFKYWYVNAIFNLLFLNIVKLSYIKLIRCLFLFQDGVIEHVDH
jgi:hypothetical protein